MAKECQKCQTYQDCVGKQWYSYSEIRNCPYQVIWVIENSATLGLGDWPDSPDGSSYIDPDVKTGYSSEAYYVKAVGILAEVNKRLARTGTDGKLLRAEVLADLDLSQESRDALMYVKGRRRKKMGYNEWKKWRKLYQKVK